MILISSELWREPWTHATGGESIQAYVHGKLTRRWGHTRGAQRPVDAVACATGSQDSIDLAVNVRDQLIKTGRVVHGRIGVAIQEVNAQLAQSFGLDRPRGALVSAVGDKGPAKKAGVQPGGVILSVNAKGIERGDQ